jgi:hypothetical protein
LIDKDAFWSCAIDLSSAAPLDIQFCRFHATEHSIFQRVDMSLISLLSRFGANAPQEDIGDNFNENRK